MNKSVLELIMDLDWNNDELTQNSAIKQLVDIEDKDIPLLIMPFNNKSYWENASVVLKKIGYPRIRSIIPDLLGWLADLNWPGSNTVFELLLSVDDNVLSHNLKNALIEAKQMQDFMWIDAMKDLIEAKNMQG